MRIKFCRGEQRKFIKEILLKINCPSLRELRRRGFDISYSSLKNYFNGRRSIPYDLFEDLVKISGVDRKNFDFEIVGENYGQIRGGKKSRKNGPTRN